MAFVSRYNTTYQPVARSTANPWPISFTGSWEDSDGTAFAVVDDCEQGDEPHAATLHLPGGEALEIEVDKGTCLVGGAGREEEAQLGRLYAVASRIRWNNGSLWFRVDAKPAVALTRHADDRARGLREAEERERAQAEERKARQAEVTLPAETLPEFPLEDALSLQRELLKGLSSLQAQGSLKAVKQVHGGSGAAYLAERSALHLAVLKRVLPAYDFAGDHTGLFDMLDKCSMHNENAQYRRNRVTLNGLFGLDVDEGVDGDEGHTARLQAQAIRARADDVAEIVAEGQRERSAREEGLRARAEDTVEVRCHPFPSGQEFVVTVPRTATFYDLRREIAGHDASMTQAKLVGRGSCCHATYQDSSMVADVREVALVLGVGRRRPTPEGR